MEYSNADTITNVLLAKVLLRWRRWW